MNERLKKRLMLVLVIFNWVVYSAFGLAILYYGNWILVSDKFTVPTESMSPTLIPGDRVVVNKLIFGARIYKNYDFSEGQPLVSWRMPGLRRIRPNDVLVFNYPRGYGRGIEFKINYVYAKRCVGAPGDTVSVVRGFYKNNRYDGMIGIEREQRMLASTPDSLLERHGVLRAMPFDGTRTIKEFAPLYVPARGDTLRLDTVSYRPYKEVIEYESGEMLSVVDGKLMLGSSPVVEHVFKGNYYFVGGDNVMNSADSRYWGFVPEEFIVGVARRIVYSRNRTTDKFRWDRFMRKIGAYDINSYIQKH
jgi:signal peptidase I